MSDEIQQEVVETTQEEQVEVVQENDVEVKARELGWRPKADFHGDESQFIDAAEFVRRQPLFEKIEHMGKELKETKKVLTMLQEHHSKVKETEYQRALAELKVQKKQALEEGDADKLIVIDDTIIELREQQRRDKEVPQVKQEPKENPEFSDWKSNNKWYVNDTEMREFADAIGVKHAQSNPDKTPAEVLKYVEAQVKRGFPDKFVNPKRSQPSAVEGGAPSGTSTGGKLDIKLTDEERRVMKTFVRSGVMTEEEYKAQLKAVRGN